jgi:cation diffusion facilitator CzcD-associated flavoprotein CzcO
MRYINLRHEVVGAKWDDKGGKWRVTIRRPKAATPSGNGQDAFEEFEDTADFVLAGMGGLSRWKWPDIDGLDSFRESNGGKGLVVHSAQWEWDGMTQDVGRVGGWEDTTKDWAGKRVGVIGVVRHSS